jgi:hypothetical protein
MKHKCGSQSAFSNARFSRAFVLCSVDVLLATLGLAATLSSEMPKAGLSAHSAGLPAKLRPVLYRLMAEEAGPEYRVDKNGCVTLLGSSLRASFSAKGARFRCADAPMVDLYLSAYGRGKTLCPMKPVSPRINDTRVSYDHDTLIERWQVLPVGYEQGFTIIQRPGGTGALTVALATNERPAANGTDVTWGKLHYSDLVVTDAGGKTVPATLKSEGDRILIAINDAHATYPVTIDPLVWLEQKVTASDGAASDSFGYSVALDGTTAVVGAQAATVGGNLYQGAAYVFTETDGIWSETQKLTASDGAAYDNFGNGVALSGTTVIVGAPDAAVNGNTAQGAAYVFTQSGGSWSQTEKLLAVDGAASNEFGTSVSIQGDTALIGAIQLLHGPGAAYVFVNAGGTWSQTAKLTASGGSGAFGDAVRLDGNNALIGAQQTGVGGNRDQGAAFVFTNQGGTWSQSATLVASDGATFDSLGSSVALEGSTALVGAPGATVNGSQRGAAYIFTESGGSWSQAQKLTASDGEDLDDFGSSVALSGATALIGAAQYYSDGNGKVYVFTESNNTWTQETELLASDGAADDEFGWSAALDGSTALIGAWGATINGNIGQGAAYFYEESPTPTPTPTPTSTPTATPRPTPTPRSRPTPRPRPNAAPLTRYQLLSNL